MNKRFLNIALTSIIAIGLCLFSGIAEAGVIDHTVTINNTTNGTATITLQMWNGHRDEATVEPNSTYKFHTGKKCPQILYGTVKAPHHAEQGILDHCIKTGGNGNTADCDGLNCKSSTHRLETYGTYPHGVGYRFIKE